MYLLKLWKGRYRRWGSLGGPRRCLWGISWWELSSLVPSRQWHRLPPPGESRLTSLWCHGGGIWGRGKCVRFGGGGGGGGDPPPAYTLEQVARVSSVGPNLPLRSGRGVAKCVSMNCRLEAQWCKLFTINQSKKFFVSLAIHNQPEKAYETQWEMI